MDKTSTPQRFIRLTSEAERQKFYHSLRTPHWWTGGGSKAPDRGWVEIFELSKWRCVYCDRDLATSTEALAESTEEHLVPRSLLEANGKLANTMHNMAACCAGCNSLKGEWVPPADDACWANRKRYIASCARHINQLRLDNFRRYAPHVENALKARAGI